MSYLVGNNTPRKEDLAALQGFDSRGATNNIAALSAYIADVAGAQRTLVFTEGVYLFDGGSTVLVPNNITVECRQNAVLELDNATTIQLTGAFEAGTAQCVELNAGGQLSMYGNTVIRPEWWGAVPDGVTDCSAAFQSAFLAGPYREGIWSNGAALKSNCQFKIQLQSGRHAFPVESGYLVGNVLTLPDYRSIHFDGGGRHGARLINDTGGDWIIQVNPAFNSFQWVALTFDGLVFDRGGLRLVSDAATINHSAQGGRIVRDCTFYATPDYAIDVGVRYVWGWIERCTFDGCGGSISFSGRDSDLWTVEECTFLRETLYPSITVRSSGITIRHCDFEVRSGTGLEQPFMLANYPCADLRILDNRFGSEPVAPVSAIDFGEDGDDTAVDPILSITVRGNQFKGYSTPDTNIAEAAIRFFKPIQRSIVADNQFWSYTTIVDEKFVTLPSGYARYSYDNIWSRNHLNFYHGQQVDRREVFSEGGIGWYTDIEPSHQQASAALTYIPSTDLSIAWTPSAAASVSASGTGPDGAIPAWSLDRTAGGSCYVNTGLVSVPEGEKMTFSVWAKAGTRTRLRLYVIDTVNRAVSSFSEIFSLTDEWRRYFIPLKVPVAATSYRFYIYNGADGTSDLDGDIQLCYPRVDVGDAPYEPTWSQNLEYIDLADYVTASMEAGSNHFYAATWAFAHAAAAGRKVRFNPRTWHLDAVQPLEGTWIIAHDATINAVNALAIDDQVGVSYNIEGGTWTDGTTTPSVRVTGRYQAEQLAPWADTVSNHTGAGTLVSGRINRVDPTAGPYTLDLPATPEVGDTVGVKNVTTDVTVVTIDGNGNNVEGEVSLPFNGSRASLRLSYDGTEWVSL